MKNFVNGIIRSFTYQIGKFLFWLLLALFIFLLAGKVNAASSSDVKMINQLDENSSLCLENYVRVYSFYETSTQLVCFVPPSSGNALYYSSGRIYTNSSSSDRHIYKLNSDDTISYQNSIIPLVMANIKYSNVDIYSAKSGGSLLFYANYPIEVDPEPTPTPGEDTELKGEDKYGQAILLTLCIIFGTCVVYCLLNFDRN